jgi:hypothetical protein
MRTSVDILINPVTLRFSYMTVAGAGSSTASASATISVSWT